MGRKPTFFQRAATYCLENPLKVCAGICLLGDVSSLANPVGGVLWRMGAGLAAFIHINSVLTGKGGEPLNPEAFRLTFDGLRKASLELLTLYKPLGTRAYWRKLSNEITSQTPRTLAKRAGQALQFWRYPLTATWMAVPIVGSLYLADAMLGAGGPRLGAALIGGATAAFGLIGFVSDDTDSAGRLISLTSYLFLGVGLATLNPALLASSALYLYSNYMLIRSKSSRQSGFVMRKEKPTCGPN